MKYISISFLVIFFMLITIVGLKECSKPEKVEFTESMSNGIWYTNFKIIGE